MPSDLKAVRQVLTYGFFSSVRRAEPRLDGGRDLKSKTETIIFWPRAVCEAELLLGFGVANSCKKIWFFHK